MFHTLGHSPSCVYLPTPTTPASPCTIDFVKSSSPFCSYSYHFDVLGKEARWCRHHLRASMLVFHQGPYQLMRILPCLCSLPSQPGSTFLLFLLLLSPLTLLNHAFPLSPYCFVVLSLPLKSSYEFVRTQPSICFDPSSKSHCGYLDEPAGRLI